MRGKSKQEQHLMERFGVDWRILGALVHDIGKFRERTFDPLPAWADSFSREAKYSHEPV